jgi:4-alpha-glucanotransferase
VSIYQSIKEHYICSKRDRCVTGVLQVAEVKQPLLQKAAQRLLTSPKFAGLRKLMSKFRADNPWLEDSALFDALRQQPDLAGLDWWKWPEPLRFRKASAIKDAHKQHKQQVDEFVAVQFLFDRQWRALKVGRGGWWAKVARMNSGLVRAALQ